MPQKAIQSEAQIPVGWVKNGGTASIPSICGGQQEQVWLDIGDMGHQYIDAGEVMEGGKVLVPKGKEVLESFAHCLVTTLGLTWKGWYETQD